MPDGVDLPLRVWEPWDRPAEAVILALHGFNDYSKGIILSTGYVGQRTRNGLVTCLTDGHPGVSGGGVLNQEGRLVGMLSLNDLAVATANEPQQKLTAATADAMRVLQAVCAHREPNRAEAKSAPAALTTVAGTTPAPAAIIATSAKSQAQAQIGS